MLCWTKSTLVLLTYALSVLWQFLINLSKQHLNYQLGDQNVPRDLPAAFLCEVCSYYWISGSYIRSDEDTSLLGSYAMLIGKQLTHN
jgi:hypothetical protein